MKFKEKDRKTIWLNENKNPYKKEIAVVLLKITGHDFGVNYEEWKRWWSQYRSDFKFMKENIAILKTIMKPMAEVQKKSVGEMDDKEKKIDPVKKKVKISKYSLNIFAARSRKLDSLIKYNKRFEMWQTVHPEYRIERVEVSNGNSG